MSTDRSNRLLNPSAKVKLHQLKMECAADLGRLDFVKENNDHYKGDLTSKQNGSEGGPIGGEMVRRMIRMQMEKMKF
jgi:hypothetical protein